jgi:hypothetical protein
VLNALYAINRRLRPWRVVARVALLAAMWLGAFVLLVWDPGGVYYWWRD